MGADEVTHTVRRDGTDWPGNLAQQYTGNANRWPELCSANPQLTSDPTYGCLYPAAGEQIRIPDSWVSGSALSPPVLPSATAPQPPVATAGPSTVTKVLVVGAILAGAGAAGYFLGKHQGWL
jgi:hypothetical protein